ncbi:type II toxin-antitoxin system VapB family antitoxin [Streptomyces sp. NPDC052701]|uniref:type II toxin-antitoxin system VapB family antitoxin n=1 Tax=Streptomyces sp. NPDC052701 TaxID=3155533 RepID=UPI003435B462
MTGAIASEGIVPTARTVIDLDEDVVAEAMRIFGTRTKAEAVRLAVEDAVKRHLRQGGFDAMDAGELDFSEIVENTGPRTADGSLASPPPAAPGRG